MATRVRKAKVRPRALPVDGRVLGGPLNGWRYLFLKFVVQPRALVLRALCTPPAWAFPKEINLDETLLGALVEEPEIALTEKQLRKFEPLRLKQRWVPLETEVEAAFKLAEMPIPTALIWDQTLSLRDLVAGINTQFIAAGGTT